MLVINTRHLLHTTLMWSNSMHFVFNKPKDRNTLKFQNQLRIVVIYFQSLTFELTSSNLSIYQCLFIYLFIYFYLFVYVFIYLFFLFIFNYFIFIYLGGNRTKKTYLQ